MRIRPYFDSDAERIKQMYVAQGFEYIFPEGQKFAARQVVVDDDNRPVMAIMARSTVELYMLADSSWGTPFIRNQALKAVHESMRKELNRQGIADSHAWLPPKIAKSFGRRLLKMGWWKPKWECFARSTSG